MTLSALNGWQRLWIVLMLVWAVPLLLAGYSSFPAAVYSPTDERDSDIVSRMPTKSWKADSCKVEYRIQLSDGRTYVGDSTAVPPVYLDERGEVLPPTRTRSLDEVKVIAERMLAAGEPGENIRLVIGHLAAQQLVKVHVPVPGRTSNVVLCFGSDASREEMSRISEEYYSAYTRVLRTNQLQHVGTFSAVWLIPGAALYALALGVAWIRRGFSRP